MYYEVYLDLLFLFFVWMNFLGFETTCMILGESKRIHGKNLALSCICSLCYCLVVVLPVGTLLLKSIIVQTLLGSSCVAYDCLKRRRKMIPFSLTQYFVSFLLVGMMEWIHTRKDMISIGLTATLGCLIIISAMRLYRILFYEDAFLCEVFLQCGGCQKKMKGLFDSGNCLREPISESMVHIINEETARQLNLRRPERLRMVPYHSVGKSGGMLEGYFADRMIVKNGKREKEYLRPCLGIYRGTLTECGDYEIILNSQTFV